MRLLVTGGSGFLGGYVLTEAAALGQGDRLALTMRSGSRPTIWFARPAPGARGARGNHRARGRLPDAQVQHRTPRAGKPAPWDGQAGRRIAAALVAGHEAGSQLHYYLRGGGISRCHVL